MKKAGAFRDIWTTFVNGVAAIQTLTLNDDNIWGMALLSTNGPGKLRQFTDKLCLVTLLTTKA